MNFQLLESSLYENELNKHKGFLPFQSGLINLGNTCYANSVFQCLFGDAELCNLVLNPANGPLYQDPDNELVTRFFNFMKACLVNSQTEIKEEVSNLLEVVYSNSGLFERGQQSDANEFLMYLLNNFKDSFDKCLPLVFPGKTSYSTCLDEYQVGLKQTTVCENGHVSERYDRTMLSINVDSKRNLGECLNDYFNHSFIERCICASNGLMHNPKNNACNSYKCEKCKMHVGAKQTLEMVSLPKNLVLHLKRFRFNGREFFKMNNHVDFELNNLKINQFIEPEKQQWNNSSYELYAICIHIGENMEQGHYTSLRRNFVDNQWRYFDDSSRPLVVHDVNQFMFRNHFEPYMLFYKLTKNLVSSNTIEMDATGLETSRNSSQNQDDESLSLGSSLDTSESSVFITPAKKHHQSTDTNQGKLVTRASRYQLNLLAKQATNQQEPSPITPAKLTSKSVEPTFKTPLSAPPVSNLHIVEHSERSQSADISARSPSVKRKKQKQSDAQRRLKQKLYMQKKREDKEFRKEEQRKNTEQKRISRSNESFRKAEQQENTERRRSKRAEDPEYRRAEQQRNTKEHETRREEPEYRQEEQQRNTKEHRERRAYPEYRQVEQQRNTKEHETRREDPEYRHVEQQADTGRRRSKRTNDPIYRQTEQKRNTIEHEIRREEPEYRQEEQQRNTKEHRERRANPEYRQKEQLRNTKEHEERRNSKSFLRNRYEDGVRDGPNYVCVCCGGLFFARSVIEFNEEILIDEKNSQERRDLLKSIFCVRILHQDKYWLCVTCQKSINDGKMPSLCQANGLAFPTISPWLQELNDLEERLVSPRIAFLRIKPLAWDRQNGLVGNVVNVPVDINTTLKQLPRSLNDCQTVNLKFMRRMNYKNAYIENVVRLPVVQRAVEYLKQQPLFTRLNITISDDWLIRLTTEYNSMQDNQPILEEGDEVDTNTQNLEQNTVSAEIDDVSRDQIDFFIPDPNRKNDQIHETLVVDDFENMRQLDQIIEMETNKIAPGQQSVPISLTSDEYGEELTFLKIFGGQLRPVALKKLTYASICKAYFRCYDRRCAENITCIFYMYKKLIAFKLVSSINLCLKRFKVQRNLRAIDVLERSRIIESYMKTEDAKRIFRTIRPSPAYWAIKKKDLFAMIRQLGAPSFFLTLSPAEIDWPELLVLLMHILEKKIITEVEAANLNRNEKIELLRRDPVTTARYFENRIRHLFNYMFNKVNGPFSANPIIDYYWRVEFQTRGSPHVHMMIWNKNTPVYDRFRPQCQSNLDAIEFIDRYITAENPRSGFVEEDNLDESEDASIYPKVKVPISFQRHLHRFNCLVDSGEQGVKICKYGYPWPILDQTLILEPLHEEHKRDYRILFTRVREELNKIVDERKECSKNGKPFEEVDQAAFLRRVDISFVDFVLALRSSIKSTKVFLKRTSADIMINPYMKDIYLRHRGNMDIQFITDAGGVVSYLTDYINKSPAVMSRLLNLAADEMSKGNLSVREVFNRMANIFQNCSEISAQECVYHLLSMPVSCCSRETVFIMTFPESDRYSILKDKKLLKRLSKESTDIYQLGMIDHYKNRPDSFENMCLAEFVANYDFYTKSRYKKRNDKISGIYYNEDDQDEDNFDHIMESNDNEQMEQQSDEEANLEKNVEQSDLRTNVDPNTALSSDENQFVKLKNNDGFVKLRLSSKILRYRRYNIRTHHDEYIREQLMLFWPWRDETKDLGKQDQIIQLYENQKEIIAENRAHYENVHRSEVDQEELERIQKEIEEYYEVAGDERARELNKVTNHLVGYNRIAPETNVTEENNVVEDDFDDETYEDEHGYHGAINNTCQVSMRGVETAMQVKAAKRLNDDEYRDLMITLNKGQYVYLMNVLSMLKKGEVFYHYVTGDAGTGKSRLIKALRETMNRHYSKKEVVRDSSDTLLSVLLAAFTGKAAANIKGTTLHCAFSIQIKESKCKNLSKPTLDKVKKMYSKLKLIIIDEISLCGSKLFRIVDHRLRQIFDDSKVFGGIPMIVLGDFKQLSPVLDKPVYDIDPEGLTGYELLIQRSLWSQFQLYELTECMRQRDDLEFAQTLKTIGRYGLIGLNDKQVAMLNSRIVADKKKDIPKDAIFLYYQNAHVNEYNAEKLADIPGELFVNFANDKIKNTQKVPENQRIDINHLNQILQKVHLDKPGKAAYSINLKLEAKYMIIVNLDVDDGLVNGTCGVLKQIDLYENNPSRAKCLWFDFMDKEIGENARQKYNVVGPAWTPIFEHPDSVKIRYIHNWDIERLQFPIVECEALTVHKSQGQTFTCVAFDLKQNNLQKQLIYVALSRCTSLAGLFLFGRKHIFEGLNFSKLNERERLAKAIENDRKNPVSIELERMRNDVPFVNQFTFLDVERNNQYINILFHNIAGYRRKYTYLNTDLACRKADMLLFSECHSNPQRDGSLLLNDFRLVRMTGCTDPNSACGQICFVHKELPLNMQFIDDNSRQCFYPKKNDIMEISLFALNLPNEKQVFICHVYNHPKNSRKNFWNEFKEFLRKHLKTERNDRYKLASPVFILGDFNINVVDNDHFYVKKMRDKLGLSFLHVNPTTDRETCIDWCLTNVNHSEINYECLVYESFFSDHKPIILRLKLN